MKDQEICDLLNARDQRGMELLFEAYYNLWFHGLILLNDLGVAEGTLCRIFYCSVESKEIHRELKPETLSSFLQGVGSKSLL